MSEESYTVEREKDGPNFVIVNGEGEQLGDVYGTRRAAIRALGSVNKWRNEETKRRGNPKDPEPPKKGATSEDQH